MAWLHRARNPSHWSPCRQPRGNPRIDCGHSLARGLLGFYLPGLTFRDLTGSGPTLAPHGSAGVLSVVNRGVAYQAPSSGGTGLSGMSPVPPSWSFPTGGTLWSYRRVTGGAAGGGLPWVIGIGDGQGDASRRLIMYDAGSNQCLLVSTSSGGTNYSSASSSAYQPTAVTRGDCVTWSVGANLMMYTAGIQCAFSGAPGAITPAGSDTVVLGWGGNQDVVAAGFWKRALSAAEIAWLEREPYAFLLPEG